MSWKGERGSALRRLFFYARLAVGRVLGFQGERLLFIWERCGRGQTRLVASPCRPLFSLIITVPGLAALRFTFVSPLSIDPVPLPHVYKGASFSERVRSAWRVSLARSLSYTRLRVSPVGQGKNAGLPRRVGLMVEGWGSLASGPSVMHPRSGRGAWGK